MASEDARTPLEVAPVSGAGASGAASAAGSGAGGGAASGAGSGAGGGAAERTPCACAAWPPPRRQPAPHEILRPKPRSKDTKIFRLMPPIGTCMIDTFFCGRVTQKR
ncbi:unnamed protein product, partial [Iphiclides podalirius]